MGLDQLHTILTCHEYRHPIFPTFPISPHSPIFNLISPMSPHQGYELLEQVVRIMGTGTGFGMVLHWEKRQGLVTQSSYGAIVKVEVSNFYVWI